MTALTNMQKEWIKNAEGDYLTGIPRQIKKGIIVGYQPKKIRRRRYKPKLNKNDQYAMQCREIESCFHYLCLQVLPNTPTHPEN